MADTAWQRWLDDAWQRYINRTSDELRGLSQGLTRNWGDEATGAILENTEDPYEGQRATGRGMNATIDGRTPYEVARDQHREQNDAAEARSPMHYGMQEQNGAVIATAPLAAVGGGLAGTVATGAGDAALAAAGESEGSTPQEVGMDALHGGIQGGVSGGLTHGLIQSGGDLARGLGREVNARLPRRAALNTLADRGIPNEVANQAQVNNTLLEDADVLRPTRGLDPHEIQAMSSGESAQARRMSEVDPAFEPSDSIFNPDDSMYGSSSSVSPAEVISSQRAARAPGAMAGRVERGLQRNESLLTNADDEIRQKAQRRDAHLRSLNTADLPMETPEPHQGPFRLGGERERLQRQIDAPPEVSPEDRAVRSQRTEMDMQEWGEGRFAPGAPRNDYPSIMNDSDFHDIEPFEPWRPSGRDTDVNGRPPQRNLNFNQPDRPNTSDMALMDTQPAVTPVEAPVDPDATRWGELIEPPRSAPRRAAPRGRAAQETGRVEMPTGPRPEFSNPQASVANPDVQPPRNPPRLYDEQAPADFPGAVGAPGQIMRDEMLRPYDGPDPMPEYKLPSDNRVRVIRQRMDNRLNVHNPGRPDQPWDRVDALEGMRNTSRIQRDPLPELETMGGRVRRQRPTPELLPPRPQPDVNDTQIPGSHPYEADRRSHPIGPQNLRAELSPLEVSQPQVGEQLGLGTGSRPYETTPDPNRVRAIEAGDQASSNQAQSSLDRLDQNEQMGRGMQNAASNEELLRRQPEIQRTQRRAELLRLAGEGVAGNRAQAAHESGPGLHMNIRGNVGLGGIGPGPGLRARMQEGAMRAGQAAQGIPDTASAGRWTAAMMRAGISNQPEEVAPSVESDTFDAGAFLDQEDTFDAAAFLDEEGY